MLIQMDSRMLLLKCVSDLLAISFVLYTAHNECSFIFVQAAEIKKQICDVASAKSNIAVESFNELPTSFSSYNILCHTFTERS